MQWSCGVMERCVITGRQQPESGVETVKPSLQSFFSKLLSPRVSLWSAYGEIMQTPCRKALNLARIQTRNLFAVR